MIMTRPLTREDIDRAVEAVMMGAYSDIPVSCAVWEMLLDLSEKPTEEGAETVRQAGYRSLTERGRRPRLGK
jgi:hypothetical protein